MSRTKLVLTALAAALVTSTGVYASEADEAIGADIKCAWKDTTGFCPAACDCNRYECPCVVITAD